MRENIKRLLGWDELLPAIAIAVALIGGLFINLSGQKGWILVGGALGIAALLLIATDSFRQPKPAQAEALAAPAAETAGEPAAPPEDMAEAARRQLALALQLAEQAYQRGAYEAAASLWGQALEMAQALGNQEMMAATYNNRGAVLAALGRITGEQHYFEEALSNFNRALELRPDEPSTLNNRGGALGKLGRATGDVTYFERALADLNRSLELRPDHPDTLMNRGAALAAVGRATEDVSYFERALADYNRSLEVRPNEPDTLTNRGATLIELGRATGERRYFAEALADLNRSLEHSLDRPHPDTLMNRGAALQHLELHEEALADFDRALELRPDHPDTLNNRGITHAALGRYAEALADYNRALELYEDAGNRRGVAMVQHNQGIVAAMLEQWPEAKDLLIMALATLRELKAPQAEMTQEVLAWIEAEELTAEVEEFLRKATITMPAEPALARQSR